MHPVRPRTQGRLCASVDGSPVLHSRSGALCRQRWGHVHRDAVREPIPAGVGAADRVRHEHPARLRGRLGRRRHEDDRPAPGHQRQGPEDEVPPLDAEQLSPLDGEAARHGAALVVELGADFRQAARLVAAAAGKHQAGVSARGSWSRRSWPAPRTTASSNTGATLAQACQDAGRRRVRAESLVSAHGSRGHGIEHRQELPADRHGRACRARSVARARLGEAHADHHEHRQGGRGRVRRGRRRDFVVEHLHVAAAHRSRVARVRGQRRGEGVVRRAGRTRDSAAVAREDGADDDGVSRQELFRDRRHRRVRARAELFPARAAAPCRSARRRCSITRSAPT